MGCATSCVEMEEGAADYAAGQLIWIERWRYRAHLVTCRVCRSRHKPNAPHSDATT